MWETQSYRNFGGGEGGMDRTWIPYARFSQIWSHNIVVTRLHGPILLSKVVTCFILPIVIIIIDSKKRPHHLCLIVYYIPENFEPKLQPHGNSKSDRPFYPTLPSTLQAISESQKVGNKLLVTYLRVLEEYYLLVIPALCPETSNKLLMSSEG